MKWKKKIQFMLLAMLILVCLMRIASAPPDKKEKNYKVSIIFRGNMDQSWENLKRGQRMLRQI